MRPEAPIGELKGSKVRGYVLALRSAGILDEVAAQVSPATRELLNNPPPSSQWVDMSVPVEVLEAVSRIKGLPFLRKIGKDSSVLGSMAIIRTFVDSMLRLFGTTPATIYSRMPKFAEAFVRGIEFNYTSLSDRSGTITVSVKSNARVPMSYWYTMAGSLETTYDSCGVAGVVGDPVIRAGKANVVDFALSWNP